MVKLLILKDELSPYSKKDIDLGNTPLDVYELCRGIKESFCLSYNIRKENVLYLFFLKGLFALKLEGQRLRFLGSDERSQALLLNKALKKKKKYSPESRNNWLKSTPGIFVKKFQSQESFLEFLKLTHTNQFILITQVSNFDNVELLRSNEFSDLDLEKYFYIFPDETVEKKHARFLDLLSKKVRLKFANFHKVTSVSDKILYINFLRDRKKEN